TCALPIYLRIYYCKSLINSNAHLHVVHRQTCMMCAAISAVKIIMLCIDESGLEIPQTIIALKHLRFYVASMQRGTRNSRFCRCRHKKDTYLLTQSNSLLYHFPSLFAHLAHLKTNIFSMTQ